MFLKIVTKWREIQKSKLNNSFCCFADKTMEFSSEVVIFFGNTSSYAVHLLYNFPYKLGMFLIQLVLMPPYFRTFRFVLAMSELLVVIL